MAKNENKALSVVLKARNELLKLDSDIIIDALIETTSLLPSKWLMDIIEMMYPTQYQNWIMSDNELYYDVLRAKINEAKARKEHKEKPASETVTTKSAPKTKATAKKTETKAKTTKEAKKPAKTSEKKPKSEKVTAKSEPKKNNAKTVIKSKDKHGDEIITKRSW